MVSKQLATKKLGFSCDSESRSSIRVLEIGKLVSFEYMS